MFETPLNITISARDGLSGKTEMQMLLKEFLESRGHKVELRNTEFDTKVELKLLLKTRKGAIERIHKPWKVRIIVLG